MLNLNNSSRDTQSLCDTHYNAVINRVELILKNILSQRKNTGLHWSTKKSIKMQKTTLLEQSRPVYRELRRFAKHLLDGGNNDLELIIKSMPEEFTKLHSHLNSLFKFDEVVNKKKVMHSLLKVIFNYEHLRKGIGNYSAFKLVYDIGINSCPYCNRQYITVLDKGEKRPPLDHFYPRSKYPIFGISFYNLIPSCYQCNSSFKGDKDTSTDKFLHPYRESFSNECHFRYIAGSIEKTELKIFCTDTDKIKRFENSNSRFEIEEVYKVHTDVAREIHNKSMKNSPEYVKHIQRIGKDILGVAPTKEAFYQFYFGNYHKEEEFEKRPLAKFTSDLVHDLRIMELFR